MDDAGDVFRVVPEVVPVDIAVGKPERAMVRVVALFACDVLDHRETPGESGAARPDERVEIRNRAVGAIFGDEFIAIENLQRGVAFLRAEFGGGKAGEGG